MSANQNAFSFVRSCWILFSLGYLHTNRVVSNSNNLIFDMIFVIISRSPLHCIGRDQNSYAIRSCIPNFSSPFLRLLLTIFSVCVLCELHLNALSREHNGNKERKERKQNKSDQKKKDSVHRTIKMVHVTGMTTTPYYILNKHEFLWSVCLQLNKRRKKKKKSH